MTLDVDKHVLQTHDGHVRCIRLRSRVGEPKIDGIDVDACCDYDYSMTHCLNLS